MAGVLAVYWRFLGGHLGKAATAKLRRLRLRANPVSAQGWLWSAVGFACGFLALNGLKVVVNTLADATPAAPPDISKLPPYAVLAYVFMISLVAGVTEEAGLRGYLQGQLEPVYGPARAILIGGLAFWVGHFLQFASKPILFFASIWYFLAAAILLGVPAWLCNSIVPSVVLHALGDIAFTLFFLWRTSHHAFADKAAFGDAFFNRSAIAAILGAAGAFLAYRQLATRRSDSGAAQKSAVPG
ncbi:MAG: CPBP family intramembrane glutamic endopeptidase [Bryobacteraceae bacterium]